MITLVFAAAALGLIGQVFGQTDCQRMNAAWPSVFTSKKEYSCCDDLGGVECGWSWHTRCIVACSWDGDIKYIQLNANGISTDVPNLSGLSSLTYLDISYNPMGRMPSQLPPRLRTLRLSGSQLSGTIPPLPNTLEELVINDNQITGAIPAIPNSLVTLDVHNNQLVGSVPQLPQTWVFQYLGYLDVSNNFLSGKLTDNLPLWPRLDGNCFENARDFGARNRDGACGAPVKPTTTSTTTTTTTNGNVVVKVTTTVAVIVPGGGGNPGGPVNPPNPGVDPKTTSAGAVVIPGGDNGQNSSDNGRPTSTLAPGNNPDGIAVQTSTTMSPLDIARSVAAGPIPTLAPLSPVSDSIASVLVGNLQSLIPPFYTTNSAILTNSLGSSDAPLSSGASFTFAAPPMPSSAPAGVNGGFLAVGSSSFNLQSVETGFVSSLAQSVSPKISNGYAEIFYTLPLLVPSTWIAVTLAADGKSLILQVNANHNLLFYQTIQVAGSGSITIFVGSTPLALQLDPNIPKLSTGQPAFSDEDFLRNATSISYLVPTCGVPCEERVPGFSNFIGNGSIASLGSVCQNLNAGTMDSFITCVSTACEAGDIESANKFTTQFSSVCSEFMQPAPILDSLNAVNNTLSFKVVFTAPGFTVLFFQYNVTDSNNQRLVTSNELTSAQSDLASVSVPIQSCNPLNVLMKYGLCDGTVSGGKECNGTVTGHLKSQDLDPTKIKGSGFYGQNCGQPVAAPVTNGNEASGPFNTTAIVGGSIAAVFSVFFVTMGVWVYKKRRERERDEDNGDIYSTVTDVKAIDSIVHSKPTEVVSVYHSEKEHPLFGETVRQATVRQATIRQATMQETASRQTTRRTRNESREAYDEEFEPPKKSRTPSFDVASMEEVYNGEVESWSVLDVSNWVYANGGGESAAIRVIEQEIDGRALMLLDVQELVSYVPIGGQLGFGKALLDLQRKGEGLPAWKP